LGRPLAPAQRATLEQYRDLLLAANQRLNLTAVRDRAGVEQRHIIESLALVGLLEQLGLLQAGCTIIDVGSGGGLPGIPLAIVAPAARVTLLEATGKKAAFLREATATLQLATVRVVTARAEEAGQDTAHREQYDLALARAVAPLDTLAELTLPLVRLGGGVAAVKGARVGEEIEAARAAVARCGGRVAGVKTRILPSGETLLTVILTKAAATPPELPRRPGIPARRPLR
jgi:16S rRNA (guanine527-N7)-methyltransferase